MIETGSKEVSVFEGFMDFLSSLTHFGNEKSDSDMIVINSVALKSQAIELIRGKMYEKVFTYFDSDKAGVGALNCFSNGCTLR